MDRHPNAITPVWSGSGQAFFQKTAYWDHDIRVRAKYMQIRRELWFWASTSSDELRPGFYLWWEHWNDLGRVICGHQFDRIVGFAAF